MLHVALSVEGGLQFRNSQKKINTTQKTQENLTKQPKKNFKNKNTTMKN
jgi:hypothetical protein